MAVVLEFDNFNEDMLNAERNQFQVVPLYGLSGTVNGSTKAVTTSPQKAFFRRPGCRVSSSGTEEISYER